MSFGKKEVICGRLVPDGDLSDCDQAETLLLEGWRSELRSVEILGVAESAVLTRRRFS